MGTSEYTCPRVICLLVRLRMKRSVVVEFSHREAQIEAGKFDGIIYSDSVERPELLSLASEDLDEGEIQN